jgi:Protein of unknown function (DUF2892)
VLVAPAAVVAAVVMGTFSVLGVALLVSAAVMLITAAVGFCPAYRLLGVDTKRFAIRTTRARVSH